MKHLFIAFAAAIVAFTIMSCKDNDDSPSGPSVDEIVGTWTMQTYEIKIAGQSSGEADVTAYEHTATFEEDGTFDGYLYNTSGTGVTSTGTYELNGNKLTITDGGGTSEYEISLSDGTLEIVSKMTVQSIVYMITMTFEK